MFAQPKWHDGIVVKFNIDSSLTCIGLRKNSYHCEVCDQQILLKRGVGVSRGQCSLKLKFIYSTTEFQPKDRKSQRQMLPKILVIETQFQKYKVFFSACVVLRRLIINGVLFLLATWSVTIAGTFFHAFIILYLLVFLGSKLSQMESSLVCFG